jgi:conjugative transfer signal peptidase TraF
MRTAAMMPETRDMPLFAWGDALRRARAERRRRSRIAAIAAGALALIGFPVFIVPRPWLVWNASASAPIGLYVVTPPRGLSRGDMVVVWLPESARQLAERRHYLPANVPAVKRIVGVAGDRVCARGMTIQIAGRPPVSRLAHDRFGRPLPAWNGCRRLAPNELFLLMADAPASFDSRYFGPVPRANVLGRARLIWRR